MIFDFFDGKCPAMRFEHGRAFFYLPASYRQAAGKLGIYISFYSIFKPIDALMGLLCGCFHRRQAGYYLRVGFALLSLLGFDFVGVCFYISKLGADCAGGMPAGCVILAGSASHLYGGGHDAVHRPRCADKRDDDADGLRHQASPPSPSREIVILTPCISTVAASAASIGAGPSMAGAA